MITFGELFALFIYACMAGYIMYLQHKLSNANRAGMAMAQLLHDVASGEAKVDITKHGILISRQPQGE